MVSIGNMLSPQDLIEDLRRQNLLDPTKRTSAENDLNEILGSFGNETDLASCIEKIKKLLKYTAPDKNLQIRSAAAGIIAKLIQTAAKLLLEEKDPEKVLKHGNFLLDAIRTVQGSGIQLTPQVTNTLNDSKQVVIERLQQLSNQNINTDQFISSNLFNDRQGNTQVTQSSGNDPLNDARRKLNNIINFLIGGNAAHNNGNNNSENSSGNSNDALNDARRRLENIVYLLASGNQNDLPGRRLDTSG